MAWTTLTALGVPERASTEFSEKLTRPPPVSEAAGAFLFEKKLYALHALAVGLTDFETFEREAALERPKRGGDGRDGGDPTNG